MLDQKDNVPIAKFRVISIPEISGFSLHLSHMFPIFLSSVLHPSTTYQYDLLDSKCYPSFVKQYRWILSKYDISVYLYDFTEG
jgi:hypothetical protein